MQTTLFLLFGLITSCSALLIADDSDVVGDVISPSAVEAEAQVDATENSSTENASTENASTSYEINVVLLTMDSSKKLSNTSGGSLAAKVGPGGTLGLGLDNGKLLSIRCNSDPDNRAVKITISRPQGDKETIESEETIDLTDLAPRSVEVMRDSSGRVTRLQLSPSIVRQPAVKRFRVEDLKLNLWSFDQSKVLLDDRDYVGTLGMAYGDVCMIDIPGKARIEFSLLPLKDSKPEGVQLNGTIEIRHSDGTTVNIEGVYNGVAKWKLDGPYRVWVRWQPSSQTKQEHHAVVQRIIEDVKNKNNGSPSPVDQATIERLLESIKNDRIVLMECSLLRRFP